MSEITKKVGTDLRAYEKKKGDDKESVAKSNRDFAELLATMPSSYNAEFNSFLGEASSLYSTDAAKIQSDFANRRIDKRTHDIQMANLNSGGKMMVDSLTGYTALINDLEEKKEAGLLGKQDLYRLSQLQSFADLGNVTLVLDPESKQPSLVKVNEDGEAEVMLINQFFNDVNMKMSGPTDTPSLVSSALKQAGIQDITLKDGSQTIGAFTGEEADAALTNAAEAGLAQINQLMGYATANVITKDGKVINYNYAKLPGGYLVGGILDEEKLKKLQAENPGIFYQDLSGKYHVSDADREIIIDNFKEDLKFASDYTEVQKLEPTKTKLDPYKSFDSIIDVMEILNKNGQKVPQQYIDLVLSAVPGMNKELFEQVTEGIEIEDLPEDITDSERKDREEAAQARRAFEVATEARTWYDNEFLSDLTDVKPEEVYDLNKVKDLFSGQIFGVETDVINEGDTTPNQIVLTIGNETIYEFGTLEPTAKDLARAKTDLRGRLSMNQKQLMYTLVFPEKLEYIKLGNKKELPQ
jgi:hypothetical protein